MGEHAKGKMVEAAERPVSKADGGYLAGVSYVVCDSCGHLWDIDSTDADPEECERCRWTSLWRYPGERRAEAKHLALSIEERWG